MGKTTKYILIALGAISCDCILQVSSRNIGQTAKNAGGY